MSRPKPGAESAMRRGFPDAVQKKILIIYGATLCIFDPAYAVSDPVPVSGGHGAAVSGVRHIADGAGLDAV